jgi:hypothetical protein
MLWLMGETTLQLASIPQQLQHRYNKINLIHQIPLNPNILMLGTSSIQYYQSQNT